jgi:hypothetical protein
MSTCHRARRSPELFERGRRLTRLVTHDSDLAAIADRVVTLDRVLASGGARRIDHRDLPAGGDLQHLGRR